MRALLWLTAALAALYSGYWLVGSRALLSGVETALSQMKADGRADYTSVDLHGFPSRFDLTINDPRLIGADGQQSWQAAFVQLFALSYRPNHLIAVWPDEQVLTIGGDTVTLRSTDLRASVTLGASLGLPLDHAELEGHGIDLTSGLGWQLLAEKLVFATRQATSGAKSHELALVLTGFAPGNDLRRLIDPEGKLPALADTTRATLIADFDRPLDRTFVTAEPRLTALRALDLAFIWGPVSLTAKGDLSVGADGVPTGKISLTVRGWRDLLSLFVTAGALTPDMAGTLENGLAAIETGKDQSAELRLPLTFDRGQVRLGPFLLGPAPRL